MKKVFPFIILFFVILSCEEGSLDEDITIVDDDQEIVPDKEDENTDPESNKGVLYIAGSYNTGGQEYGAYWTDSNNDGKWDRTDLDDSRVIHDIIVKDGIIYAVGETTWIRGDGQDPALWINGIKTELDAPNNDEDWGGATAYAIAIHDDDIYISGNYASKKADFGGVSSACYWIVNNNNPQGKLYPLENGVSSDAYGIAILNGQPISVGWYQKEHKIMPAKWVGNKRSNLDGKNDGEAMDIVVDGENYYISGWTDNKRQATHYYPTVWKNNQSSRKTLKEGKLRRNEVSSNDREAYASSIIAKNGNIYATGYTYFDYSVTSASYWTIDFSENNPVNEITEFNGGEMKDLVISENGDIITVGSGELWINGTTSEVIDPAFVVYPNAITISE